MGLFSIALFELGLSLGWVYSFMGILIGSAVVPLWNLMTWTNASGTGAVVAAWGGLFLAIVGWILAAKVQSGVVSVDTLGTNEGTIFNLHYVLTKGVLDIPDLEPFFLCLCFNASAMLSGNLIAILSSACIHYIWSVWIDPQEYDFSELDRHISLVEHDEPTLSDDETNSKLLDHNEQWIKVRGVILSVVLVIVWPLLSLPAGVFSQAYFSFWVLVSLAWGFGAAFTMFMLPLIESSDDIFNAVHGIYCLIMKKGTSKANQESPPLHTQQTSHDLSHKTGSTSLLLPYLESAGNTSAKRSKNKPDTRVRRALNNVQ
jgi:urea-proton symporter